jgi:peptidoglycan/xylan/chitin deacetylase (PgdA/CDA1 family)
MVGISCCKWTRNMFVMAIGCVRRMLGLTQSGKRVIAFHDVKDAELLRKKLEWLMAHYEIVSLEELLSRPLGQRTQIAITFDDGYASWHEVTAPVLEDLKIPAVFFVCSGFVGLRGQEAEYFGRRYFRRQQKLSPITRNQLVELANQPLFEIGGHTVHHIDLGRPLDENTLIAEIYMDRYQLENWTGTPVRWFAYPFGEPKNVFPQAVNFVRRMGFLAAFTLVPSYWKPGEDRFKIGRDSLDLAQPLWLWRTWLSGAYDGLYTLKERLQLRRQTVLCNRGTQ